MSLRSGRMSLGPRPESSLPRKRIDPLSFSTIRTTLCAVVVLPQPDSPTSASISPGATLNVTPSTACTCSFGARRTAPTKPRGTG